MQLSVGSTGAVEAAAILKTTLGDGDVARCVAKAERWTFPVPVQPGPAVVAASFTFSPR